MSEKMSPKRSLRKTKPEFRLKLLSDSKVVLLESTGYESEIFIPEINNGRITFQNVLPDRRCCQPARGVDRLLPSSANKSTAPKELKPLNENIARNNCNTPKLNDKWRIARGQEHRQAVPISVTGHMASPMSRNVSKSFSKLLTPEPLRNTEVTSHIFNGLMLSMPNGVNGGRLHRSPSTQTPHKLRRIKTEQSGIHNYARIPVPPCSTPCSQSSSMLLPKTPEQADHVVRRNTVNELASPMPKWRKCITPRRTYSRSNVGTSTKLNRSAINAKRQQRVLPNYLINPTQGPKPIMNLVVRRRKLLLDAKKTISPRSFKQQQRTPAAPRDPVAKTPRTRKQLNLAKESAIDLLTTASRSNVMATELQQQFRKGCISKPAATQGQYKLLCTMPPLGRDNETKVIRAQMHDNELTGVPSGRSSTKPLAVTNSGKGPIEKGVTFDVPSSTAVTTLTGKIERTTAALNNKRSAKSLTNG